MASARLAAILHTGDALTTRWPQALVLFAVYALFAGNALGLLDVVIDGTVVPLLRVAGSPEFVMLTGVGLLLSVLLPLLRPIPASLLTLLAMLVILYAGYAAGIPRPLVPMEYSLLTVLVMFGVNVLTAYFTETQQKQKLLHAFGQYVPPEVVAYISRDPEHFSLDAEARELSVMFCDIRNFSGISEFLEPRQLSEMLNTLFTPVSRIIYKHHGVIDKYLGDGVMAFWGAPVPDANHATNAVLAAFEIQEALAEMRKQFPQRGWPPLSMGIGINTGVMSVGNMGSSYRVAYTVVGDAVNLASRLQDLTRVFRVRIIVGEGTRKAFPSATYRELGLVKVRGKTDLVRIYEPCNPAVDPESTVIATMQRHNQALHHYYAREWAEASRLFLAIKARNGDDPLYDYYLRRIAEFQGSPPPPDWSGEIRFTVK